MQKKLPEELKPTFTYYNDRIAMVKFAQEQKSWRPKFEYLLTLIDMIMKKQRMQYGPDGDAWVKRCLMELRNETSVMDIAANYIPEPHQ
jgi:hypothetical protein